MASCHVAIIADLQRITSALAELDLEPIQDVGVQPDK